MYLCFHWLKLSGRSIGVINTLQQLTFNILPQPLTPLIADWLCKAWEPCGWEWHGSILSVCQSTERTASLQNLWLQLIPYRYKLASTRERKFKKSQELYFVFLEFVVCSKSFTLLLSSCFFLSLPFDCWHNIFCLHSALISAATPNTLPSTQFFIISSEVIYF